MCIGDRADALEAAADLATAEAGRRGSPSGSSTAEVPARAGADRGDGLSPRAAQVRDAYRADGPVLPLGALVEAGTAEPRAQVGLPLRSMNRHGLVAGATGTGKTRTLQLMTEGLARAGVPVFVTDLKGDLSGLASPGTDGDRLRERAASVGQEWTPTVFPVEPYTLGGLGTGTPIRTTVTDFGPLLLAKVLGLNATQESSLGLVFHWADQQGLALLDLKDLQAVIGHLVSEEGRAELQDIGGLSRATAGVILREVVALQAQGGDVFFGEPAFDTADLLRTTDTPAGRWGVVSALELPGVQDRPALFSTFLMWLLADLFQSLPEVGDPERPALVFFFDEAHLLFSDASKDFLAQVTQTVRLIRSKGVGVVLVTQTPKDVPPDVLAQLGNRVQHALRAHTPDDEAALRATARTFPRSDLDLAELLTTLGTGEALITVLSEDGAPTPVAHTRLRAPESSMSPAPEERLRELVAASPVAARYGSPVDRESAYELLTARTAQARADAAADQDAARRAAELEEVERSMRREPGTVPRRAPRAARRRDDGPLDALLRSAGTALGREITRTIFGTRRR
ncbi:DUF853 family protein [Cellulomonas sp. APG4]|uniref:helicase HerA-like domain-containing protein n=1 Tax=Cellulomonas sp. APG4 TaxID=1538656 RepID=UPI00137A3721|nr:helicase HerA-like domain-containing protein [Cellulomonas sp. APG4]NCT90559.1 DUF853 family protein [Cellulomonas sp. APG4]